MSSILSNYGLHFRFPLLRLHHFLVSPYLGHAVGDSRHEHGVSQGQPGDQRGAESTERVPTGMQAVGPFHPFFFSVSKHFALPCLFTSHFTWSVQCARQQDLLFLIVTVLATVCCIHVFMMF